MIASITSAWRRARAGHMAGTDGAGDLDLTRSAFLRVAAAGIVTAGIGMAAGRAIAASRHGIAPVTDVEKLYDAWQERFNAADLDAMMDLYLPDVAFISPQGKTLTTPAAIRADFAEAFALKPVIDIHDRRHIRYRDIVLTTNHWSMTLTGPDGKPEQLTGGGIEVLQKQSDGGWRFIIDDASRSAS
ncbi:SgcJ/EcaC family oxidoreductase [Sphingobium sp. HBC34]|uniref:SgcJ/EcaC family oxidoreductase n=1 Tax=Sphingobium cyanobacteriorum TaxID=3063954 RepID=A0ABT8ZN06_9SPHN|nr:SgcJ/EcaC family oxidoreductase [Sphingobium sp. HBC34]MDO7835567.1 SgcJ/EcaC family oxidoreductase [Sphingobium sp. HBC34]